MYKRIIIKLQAITVAIKAFAVKRQENRIIMAAELTDAHVELAEKRLAFADAMRDTLHERAATKMVDGITKANDAKRKAGKELDELNAL